jgi:uncharacterized repeat protein (TIGR01451 family)
MTVGVPSADMQITKSVTGQYYSGGIVKYTITYTNNGPTTGLNLRVDDLLHSNLSGISANPARSSTSFDGINTTYSWTGLSNLNSGQSASIVFTAKILSDLDISDNSLIGQTINNTVSITGTHVDTNTGNDSYTAGFTM